MKTTPASLLVFCFLFFLPFCSFSSDTLRVMTFNIRYDKPDDSIYAWSQRRDMVLRVIRNHKPDIFGIQEGLENQLNDLQSGLTGYQWKGIGRDDGNHKGEFAAVFYRSEILEAIEDSTFWLSQTPRLPGSISWGAACTRIVTWVKFRDRECGTIFYLFNTHFDHMSEQARLESARLLKQQVMRIAGKYPAIITGDFNDTRTSVMYQELVNPVNSLFSFKDARDLAPLGTLEPQYSYVGFPFNPEKGSLVDHIFIRPFHNVHVSSYHVLTDHEGNLYPSDHLPILIDVIIKQ